MYSNPLVYAVALVAQKPLYTSHRIDKNNCQKDFYYTEILYYKTMLYKFIWTRSKNRVIENCVMKNRVKWGITV